jgi:hypothetical protein
MKSFALLLMSLFVMVGQARADNLYVLLDLSDSPMHVKSKEAASQAGAALGEMIRALPLGSRVDITSFGEFDQTKNPLHFSFQLLNKPGQRPADIANAVQTLVGSIDELIKSGRLVMQAETHILAELRVLAQRMVLTEKNTIVLLSDMLEYSPEANATKLTKAKVGGLPTPPQNLLQGARVIALGAGYGLKSDTENARLQGMWSEYFRTAGAEFQYLSKF